MMRYYGKREIHFGICPWVQISAWLYWFERLVMRNECLNTEVGLQARGFELHLRLLSDCWSLLDRQEYERICFLIAGPRWIATKSVRELQEKL